jgi:hypothetical protein
MTAFHGCLHGCALALLLPALPCQAAKADWITETRVQDVVEFLAGDDLKGRDTPSPGLEKAAEFIAGRFKSAGLVQARADSWYHEYTLPGLRIDSNGLESVKVVHKADKAEPETGKPLGPQECELKAGDDVRLLQAGDSQGEKDQPATVGAYDDPRMGRMLMGGGRRPILLEVETSEAIWGKAEGERLQLGEVRRGSMPVFLVRKGALPKAAFDSGSWTVTWKGKAAVAVEAPLRNVVGVVRGKELPDEYVLVSAHYDHVGVGASVNGDAIYNGADDDASGTTAVVLLAEALAQGSQPRRSIAFVCFSAEEKGLRGSRAFAQDPPFPLAQVVCNVNIEMIGRPPKGKEQQAWITGAEYSDFAAIAGPALQRAGIELVGFGMATNLFGASDNWSLAAKGVVAHSISAGELHRDYHQPTDHADRLNKPHMTAVIRGLREVVLEFANRAAAPAWNDQGRKRIEAGKRGR